MLIDLNQPQVTAAVVAGAVALVIGFLTVLVNSIVTAAIAERKLRADRALALSEKAWADYELRRDVYLEVGRIIDSLYEGGDAAERREYLRSIRKLWVVGTDEVVKAANALSVAIQAREGPQSLEQKHGDLFNAMRRDIRRLHVLPPKGTDLGPENFPVQRAGQ